MPRPLLISHDLSYSGGPIALWSLAEALQRLGERPMVAALAGGPLSARFLESGIELVDEVDVRAVAFVIANTILAVPAALHYKRFGVPVAAWVHESMQHFKELDLTPQECGLQHLDVVLGPARFQLMELAPYLRPGTTYQLRNTVAMDSFRPTGDEPMIAVCGAWGDRKGQPRLCELARRSGAHCRFKFIGPSRPVDHVDSEPLSPQHVFLGALEPERAKVEIARSAALASCSRAETQPLVVIEALMAGRPVLLSDIQAHRTLADALPNVFLFDPKSSRSFMAGYRKLTDAIPDESVARKASAAARALFDRAVFDQRLGEIVRLMRGDAAPGSIPQYQDSVRARNAR